MTHLATPSRRPLSQLSNPVSVYVPVPPLPLQNEVVVRPDVEVTPLLMDQVLKYIQKFEHTCRHEASRQFVASRREAVLKVDVPTLEHIEELLPLGAGR